MRTHIFMTALTALTLFGCGSETKTNSPDTKTTENTSSTPDNTTGTQEIAPALSIVPTTFLETPEVIIRASIAPKPGLQSWSSKILLLSETGKIYTGNTGFAPVEKLLDGPYQDLQGLSMGFEPAVFLTQAEDGSFKAYQEDGNGSFQALSLSKPDGFNGRFCGTFAATPDLFVMELGGTLTQILYTVEDGLLTLETGEALPEQGQECLTRYKLQAFDEAQSEEKPFDPSSVFEDEYSDDRYVDYEISLENRKLIYRRDGKTTPLSIESGLSMSGMEQPRWLYITSAPLGNTFNGGAVMIGDGSELRVVMISLEYLNEQAAR